MNLKIFRFYRIPHPLLKDASALVSDAEERTAMRTAVREFQKGTTDHRPRVIQMLISADDSDTDGRIREYLSLLKRKEDTAFNKAKLRECMRFAMSLIAGYLLFIAPPAFWRPIETVFDSVAHGLSDYAKWWVILFFPVRGFIRTFGTGFSIGLPAVFPGKLRRIGTVGRWQKINAAAASTEVYRNFGDDLTDEFRVYVEKCIVNIRKKTGKLNGGSVEQLLSSIQEHAGKLLDSGGNMSGQELAEWNNGFNRLLLLAGDSARTDGIFPWGEIPKLDRLRSDLLYFGGRDKFKFAPLRIISPRTPAENFEIFAREAEDAELLDMNLETNMSSAMQQSRNLKQYFERDDITGFHERLQADYQRLAGLNDRTEIAACLESIAAGFAGLRDRLSFYHLGANSMIPNERGRALSNFYHRLYLIFGRASCDIENGFRRAAWGFRPVAGGKGAVKRAGMAVEQAFYLIENRKPSGTARAADSLLSALGRSLIGGLGTSAAVLFLIGSVFSFYILDSGQTAILNNLRLGYQGRYVNTEVVTRNYSDCMKIPRTGYSLGWHPPSPFTRMQKIDRTSASKFTVHMIIGESRTDNLWKKFLQAMSGQLGMNFDVVELEFEYLPVSTEAWKNYNADGKGNKRLVRDTSSLIDEWKAGILSSYDGGLTDIDNRSEVNHIFTTYFRELAEDGIIEDYIRRSFSQTALSTHVYYGSPLERYEPGFVTVIDELQRRADSYENDPLLTVEEKRELTASMTMAKTVVEETMDRIEAQVNIEYGGLRRNPDMLMELVKDPYSHLQELRDFETLWSGIQNYTWHLYNQEKMKEIFSSGYREIPAIRPSEDETDYILRLMYAIEDDQHLNKLIKLKALDFRMIDMGVSQLNLIQQKWKDII